MDGHSISSLYQVSALVGVVLLLIWHDMLLAWLINLH